MSRAYIDFKMENNLLTQTALAHETLDYHGDDLHVTEWDAWTEFTIEFEGAYMIKALVNNYNRAQMRGVGVKNRKDKILELYNYYLDWKASTQPQMTPAQKGEKEYLERFNLSSHNAIAGYNYAYLITTLQVMEFNDYTYLSVGTVSPIRGMFSKTHQMLIDHTDGSSVDILNAYQFYINRREMDRGFNQQRKEIKESQDKQLTITNLYDMEKDAIKALSLIPQFIAVCEENLEESDVSPAPLSYDDYELVAALIRKLVNLENHVDQNIFE